MRGNSQLPLSANYSVDKTTSMKTPVMLLLSNDNELEELVADALSEIGGHHLSKAWLTHPAIIALQGVRTAD